MKYSRVAIQSFGYELPSTVVTSEDLERRLEPMYAALRLQRGQLEAITGIRERRYWDPDFPLHQGAARAGRKAIEAAGIGRERIGMLIYGAVCRENLEPASACAVADALGLAPECQVYDVSNACLGVLNGMVNVANAIELGQIQAGLVVACESAREIVDLTIDRLNREKNMEVLRRTVATLTGGSGAVAVLLTDPARYDRGHRIIGGTARSAAEHHRLCVWGPDTGIPGGTQHMAETDSVKVLQNGVALGIDTFRNFRKILSLPAGKPDKIICHQVGATHQRTILDSIGIPADRDFTTFRFLGNIGTVSLPITAAIAEERGFLVPGDLVGFLGIGSGLNCLMLGIEW
ncbi:MAG: 3-oxoacyl-ACP synthase III [Hyphomicrobiales bacterium]